ncbi:MAG: diacylglycerol kinase family lipid kinase [Bacteroidales bacterium]|nr:diacylglycerol kinase family lipid kinase [Bacteroidales bacterium]
MTIDTLSVRDYVWHVIINPNACEKRCFDSWQNISDKLDESGIRHELHRADAIWKGMEMARELCRQGHRHLVVIGGDGTINEVVNGIFLSGVDTKEVFLAVLPLGRGNDWARAHNFPTNLEHVMEVFRRGHFLRHDIGRVTSVRENEEPFYRYFINIAGFGFDAEVIYDVTYNKPHFAGISVYMLSLARMLFRYKSQPLRVQSPDFSYDGKTFMMVAAIGKYNGGGMCQAPESIADDGLFDVVIIPKVSNLRVIANVKNLSDGSHVKKIKGIQSFHTASLTIESDCPVRGEVEGELLPVGRYDLDILPNSLNVLTNLS